MKQCFSRIISIPLFFRPGLPPDPCQPELTFAGNNHLSVFEDKLAFSNSDEMTTVSQRLF